MPLSPKRILGSRKEKNQEVIGASFVESDNADYGVSDAALWQQMSRSASLNAPADIASSPREVYVDASPTLEMGTKVAQVKRRNPSDEEHIDHAQNQLTRLMRVASNKLGAGDMTTKLASDMLQKVEELTQYGALLNSQEKKVATSLRALAGDLEL